MTRTEKLMPNGVPRWIRVYDNEGETADRYTVVYTGRYRKETPGWFPYVGMSARPFHPQGFGQHGENQFEPVDCIDGTRPPAIGRKCHLGRRIEWDDLPEDCQNLVLRDYCELWSLPSVVVEAPGTLIKKSLP